MWNKDCKTENDKTIAKLDLIFATLLLKLKLPTKLIIFTKIIISIVKKTFILKVNHKSKP